MAFVVARPRGRYEIREAVHTPEGPRARTLANFAVLTDDFLSRAAARASRAFDPAAVLASAARVGAPIRVTRSGSRRRRPAVDTTSGPDPRYRRFVATSRRLSRAFDAAPSAPRSDPGRALMELLDFADDVGRSLPPRPDEPLTFPPLDSLVHRAGTQGRTRRR
jgi:hypothetical protein